MAVSFTLLVICLFSIPGILNGGHLFDKSVFEGFRSCLIVGGLSGGDIVERDNSESYNRLNYQWQQQTSYIQPMAYILVQTEGNVEVVVVCGRKWNLPLIPKGGGHSLHKYSFGNSHSVVIDLTNLKTLHFHESKMSVSVGTGWLFGPLTFQLWKMGQVFIPFPDCPTVGVGGVATGGGMGFFARKFGIIADSILEARIVIANGSLLTANRKRNSDLFWALRGGIGSNFGVITQLVFKIYPVPPSIFYGTLSYDVAQFVPVFDAWQRHVPIAPNSISFTMYIRDGKIMINCVDSDGDGINFEILAKKFPQNVSKSTTVFTYPDFMFHNYKVFSGERMTVETVFSSPSDLINLNRDSPEKVFLKRKSFYVTRKIGSAKRQKIQRFVEAGMPSGVFIYFESSGGAINDVPKDGTAFVHRGKTLYNTGFQYKDYNGNSTAATIGTLWLETFFEFCKGIFHHKESYQNYVDEEMKDYLERYFGSNLPRLVQVKRKYDPQNYWRNPQSIPTAL